MSRRPRRERARRDMSGGDGQTGRGRAGVVRLLLGNRAFLSLWCARGVSFLGDSLGLVALLLYTAEATGQALSVALLLLVGDFAPALLGPLTGVASDRFDPKRVMVSCELAQGVLTAVVALTLPPCPCSWRWWRSGPSRPRSSSRQAGRRYRPWCATGILRRRTPP